MLDGYSSAEKLYIHDKYCHPAIRNTETFCQHWLDEEADGLGRQTPLAGSAITHVMWVKLNGTTKKAAGSLKGP